MSRCGIELTSNDPAFLSFLVKYPTNPSWSVIEVEGRHYLISPIFQGLTSSQDVWQAGDNLLFFLNTIAKLKFKSTSLERGSTVAYFDENNEIMSRTGTRSIPMRVSLSAGESYYQDADAQQPSIIDVWLMAKNNPLVEEALQYYAIPHTWFSLRKIFEIISRDVKEAERNNKLLPNTWNTWARGWVNDFWQTANSYHLSGLDALHSSVESEKKAGVIPMPLNEAIERITDLLMKWLQSNP